jgi:signal transduction histidine kinase/CheY-like chemotaxis protein
MPNTNVMRTNLMRLVAFLATGALLYVATADLFPWNSGRASGAIVRFAGPVMLCYGALVVLGILLGRRGVRDTFPFLAGDLLAIGALGCALTRGTAASNALSLMVPFLSGYIVAVLVSVIGRRHLATTLGSLAGAMVMGLCAAFVAIVENHEPDLALLVFQFLLLIVASVDVGSVTSWLEAESLRQRTSERVERELRSREVEAGEIVAFTQALATSGTMNEVAEAVLRHMRCHIDVRARAIALEARGESVAIWEEQGTLDPDHVERRRSRIQEALARAGTSFILPRLEARSMSNRLLPHEPDFDTVVEVPIQAWGRATGVILLGDPRRDVIPDQRIGVIADVARRTGEAVMRILRQGDEEQRRTSLLLRQMREGVLLLGPDGTPLLVNPAARDVLAPRGDVKEIEGVGDLALADLARTPPGVSRRFQARVQPVGSHRPFQLAGTAVAIVDGGKRIGTLVTLVDVTEEEAARRRLVQAEKMTLVGQTLAGVAHELNNPLAALIGYADLLEGREVPPELERPVRQMREQALRAGRIVRNLLNFAKQRNPERTPVSLGDLVQSVIDLFAYEIRLANISLETDIQADLPSVLADKHALQQVAVNLVQNSIHVLQDHAGDRRISIRAHALPEALLLSVRDSGPGIPEDFRVRIFEPFFTTKGAAKGTGLGLTLSRSIAREHGGDLILETPDDRAGACFTLRLPLPRASEVVAPAASANGNGHAVENGVAGTHGNGSSSPHENGHTPAYHALVVDDEAAVRDALVSALGRLGCRVESVGNISEAQRLLARGNYDVVLLDLRMPGGGGLDLHATLLQERPEAAERVVFMTGDFTNEDMVQAVRATGCTLLEKPFTMDELSRVLRAMPRPPAGAVRFTRQVVPLR